MSASGPSGPLVLPKIVSVYLCFCTIDFFCLSVLLYHRLILFICVFVP